MTECAVKIALRRWRPDARGNRVGFADVELLPFGLRIDDIAIHQADNGKAWVCMPGVPVLDETGQQRRGKNAWAALFHWRDEKHKERFRNALLTLIRARCPGALSDAAEPR
jgi:hypothetical protein